MMKPTTRGRPKVATNDISVPSLTVKFLCIKEDKYKIPIAYFKVADEKFKSKMKALLALTSDPDLRLPFWKTDKDEYLIKVKVKHMIYPGSQLKVLETYPINFEFTPYDFESEGKQLKGYYSKVLSLGIKTKEIVEPEPEPETDNELEV
jgi:hypothetical protein